ncbi:DUF3578 domain-containing protein [Chitinophaga sp. SYP-B3965]|uniref:MrcB family domain-containing protein n=1 Tax=Chitinophaga sp. SYP-B3965 TaxID=2663120 RepID=UPI001299B33F|nr:DUF3578 domain-containing protein [Chitinophaga sp. SYP-B3965]MRG44262.1 DUF3578 domain-containing protein [Chitinophaga sp. SYP-B3965]
MSLPKNITKNHLLDAIAKIDKEGIPVNGDSRYYDVIYKGKAYPPKLIVSYANLFANGSILDRDTFEGGLGTECFKLLEMNGFEIMKKNIDFSQTLIKFLAQANSPSPNLKTKEYKGVFNGLDIKASFGTGNSAIIPWLALLGKGQKVSQGIYPVYLYYKEQNVLILAYGVSETNEPDRTWKVSATSVQDFLLDKYSTKPKHYGSSLVFKHYNIDKSKSNFGLDLNAINEDINELANIYNGKNLNTNTKIITTKEGLPFQYMTFVDDVKKANLKFSENHTLRFILSLCAKPFVILTGLSGSGKTKLAQAFSHWICKDERQICFVPVGADWTNREPLLGYPNALEKGSYVIPENGALSLLLEAVENQDDPYFLILDEMNLSHVEKYFADFLSAMESTGYISLHPKTIDWEGSNIKHRTTLPPNLFIIGTVNIDETTYMFSPKVLDRANVIEFRVSELEMKEYLSSSNVLDFKSLKEKGSTMANDFVKIAKNRANENLMPKDDLNETLLSFFNIMQTIGAEFGYRCATEIHIYWNIARQIAPNWEAMNVTDSIIMQKLLPKVHGAKRRLESPLRQLATLCVNLGKEDKIQTYLNPEKLNEEDLVKIKYPLSMEKIRRMYQRLMDNGFTSYAEA